MNEEIKPRKVMIVLEDDGHQNFNIRLDGDVERIGLPQIPVSLYSPAEFWGVQFFGMCQEMLRRSNEVGPVKPEGDTSA